MSITRYDQRLSLIESIDFGKKTTLATETWEEVGTELTVIPRSSLYEPYIQLKKRKNKEKSNINGEIHRNGYRALYDDSQHNNKYDPFRGNSFARGKIGKQSYLILPCGDSLSCLRIVSISMESLYLERKAIDGEISHFEGTHIPLGSLSTVVTYDMGSPILQIAVSHAKDITMLKDTMIIGIRTIYYTALLKVTRDKIQKGQLSVRLIHEFKPREHCQPSHIVLSPYTGYSYAMVDDNGYVAVFNTKQIAPDCPLGMVFEMDLNSLNKNDRYSRKWKACLFGPHPKSLILASSDRVELWEFKAYRKGKTIYKCDETDRIYCLEGLNVRNSFQFCITTTDHILLMDARYPYLPVITWEHHLKDDPPTSMQIFQDESNPDIINVIAWPVRTDTAIYLHYNYNGKLEYNGTDQIPLVKPATYSSPTFLSLKKHEYDNLWENGLIPTIGGAMETKILRDSTKPTDGDSVLLAIFFRVLNDGAIHAQLYLNTQESYFTLYRQMQQYTWTWPENTTNLYCRIKQDDVMMMDHLETNKREQKLRVGKTHNWNAQSFFSNIIQNAVLSRLSVSNNQLKTLTDADLHMDRTPGNLYNFVNHAYLTGLDKSCYEELENTIMKQNFIQPTPQNMPNSPFWTPIPGQRDILPSAYEASTNSICNSLVTMNTTQKTNRNKLNEQFADDMYRHLMYYIPVANDDSQDDAILPPNQQMEFQYLQLKHKKQQALTVSTRVFGQDWIPGEPIEIPTLINAKTAIDHDHQPVFLRYKGQQQQQRQRQQQQQYYHRHDTSLDEQEMGLPPSVITSSTQAVSSTLEEHDVFSAVATQPLPGAFANRPAAVKKKKKKKVSGFM
ncbi:uncharacterized protein BX664DRAFT_362397 [Halteromyces radiatus]|uniref:uncharacterized protein n=1 Tax=Halteromyces radiatus TaxID=101107 RepID=UPI00222091DD|nr:uncharacterized protein BX664DRAFT_362397 [Halteromyces radiatus]KAI8078844.1 hypothetical protein BX664DRAFT_362397 [Halteromyces radiatus]